MGYRSDVTIALHGTKEDRDAYIAKMKLEGILNSDTLEYVSNVIETEKAAYFEFRDIKWYPDYDEIAAWDTLCARAADEKNIAVERMIVGEDSNDNQHDQWGRLEYTFLTLSRSIEISE